MMFELQMPSADEENYALQLSVDFIKAIFSFVFAEDAEVSFSTCYE